MTGPISLHHWSLSAIGGPFQAPELCCRVVIGRRPDGVVISTAAVVAVRGRIVTTSTGSRYRLGAIDPSYRKWLKDNKISYDPRHPIRTK